MPKRLLERCRPDSIREFRLAGRRRFDDGLALAAKEGTGAIYMWGYTAEMVLKAAYFSLQLTDTEPITWAAHLQPAIAWGRALEINWPGAGAGHNIRAWTELLILQRAATPGIKQFTQEFGNEVRKHSQRVHQLWRETLRYRGNKVYIFEVKQVRESVEWLLVNSKELGR